MIPSANATSPGPRPGHDELRRRLHAMWSSVAGAWDDNSEFVDERGAHVSQRMLALTAPQPRERVLELACGPGGPGLEIAARPGSGVEVVLSDVADAMTRIAARRAEALGLPNVTARSLDLEEIDEPDASYDVILCREGLMLVQDPARAAREIRRVLRPGGRVALSVWGTREENPWLGVLFDVVAEQFGTPMPPPGSPHPLSLADADRLAALLAAAGLADVAVERLPTPYLASSPDEWWQRTVGLAGPLAKRLASLPAPAAEALRDRACGAISVYAGSGGLEIPGVCLVASGTRPEADRPVGRT